MADPTVKKITELTAATGIASDDQFVIVDVSEALAANRTKKISANMVKLFNAAQITDGIILDSKLATNSVTNTKIADGAVSNLKLRNSAGNSVIGNPSNAAGPPQDIVARSDQDGQVLKRFGGGTIGFGTVSRAGIADEAITEIKLATNSVTNIKIADGAITESKLANGAVTQAKLSAIVRTIVIPVYGDDEAVTVKNHPRRFTWPPALNGHVITGVNAVLSGNRSTSGSVIIEISNGGGVVATLSILAGQWSATTSTISATYKTASSLLPVGINVTAAGTSAKGLTVYLEMLG